MAKKKRKFQLSKMDFGWYLMVISVLGYFTIFVSALFKIDIGSYVDSFLFLIIGLALMISGSIQLFFKYFKGGLTKTEINRIVSIVVGMTSAIIGIITLPFIDIQADVLDGIKAVIAVIAIITIISERYTK